MEAFASTAQELSPVLVMERVEGAIVQHLIVRDRGNLTQVTKALQEAVAARLDQLPDDEELALDPRDRVTLTVPMIRQQTGRATQSGQDPFLVAKRVAPALVEDGQWVAVAFRKPSGRERARWSEFKKSHNVDVHHSMEREAVLASFTAGGGDRVANEEVLKTAAASMPGFDEIVSTRSVSPRALRIRGIGVGVLLAMVDMFAGALLNYGIGQAAPPFYRATGIDIAMWGVPLMLVLAALGIGVGAVVAVAHLLRARSVSAAATPVLSPRRRVIPAARPQTKRDEDGNVTRLEGRRPLRRDVFMVGPAAFVGLAAPHVGTESGASSTRDRSAPAELVKRVGTAIGVDHRGSRVHLPAASTFEGTAIVGGPGTGKTQYQLAEWAHQLAERTSPSGLPGFPGRENTMVFFDTKGDTWIALKQWCDHFGVPALVVHLADNPWMSVDESGDQVADPVRRPNSPVIDVLRSDGNALDRARFVADMMKETLDEGDVRGQSLESLTKVFTAAFATTDVMVERAREAAREQGVPFMQAGDPVTPVSIAHAYLGDPDPRAGELIFQQLSAQAEDDLSSGLSTSDAVAGAQALSTFYGDGVTASVRRSLMQAPRNKISLMQAAKHFWDTADHSADVGSSYPGGPRWLAEQEAARAAEETTSPVSSTDPFGGFTSVAEDGGAMEVGDGFDGFGEGDFDAGDLGLDSPSEPELSTVDPEPELELDVDTVGALGAKQRVFSWEELLRGHHVVIVNSGVAPESGSEMPVNAAKLVTSMTFFALERAIRKSCRQWRENGRRVTVMADELSMVAEDNVETIEWLRDKGRGFGVELSLATQRQAQLPEKVKSSFLGFGTLIAFTQDNEKVAAELASNLAGDGSKWEQQDIVNLPRFSAVVRTRTSSRLPAFTVKMANFEADRSLFTAYQSGEQLLPGEKKSGGGRR